MKLSKIFTLRNGAALLLVEVIAVAVLYSSQQQNDATSQNPSLTSRSGRGAPSRGYETYQSYLERKALEGGEATTDFLSYAREALSKHGSGIIDRLSTDLTSQDRSLYPAFYALLAEEYGLTAALGFENLDLDPQTYQKVVLAIALYLAENNPLQVIDFVKDRNAYLFTEDMLLGQLIRSEKMTLNQKLEFLENVPKGASRDSAVDFLAQEAVKRKDDREFALLSESQKFNPRQLGLYQKVYGHHLISTDLAGGIDFLAQHNFRPDLYSFSNLRDYAKRHAAKDAMTTIAKIQAIDDPRVRNQMMKGGIDALISQDPEEGIRQAAIEFKEGHDNGSLLNSAYAQWLAVNPEAALGHLRAGNLTEPERQKILSDNFSVVADKDPRLAESVITEFSGTVIEDSLRAAYGTAIASESTFQDRLRVITGIQDLPQQMDLLEKVTYISAGREQDSVRDFLQNGPDGSVKDAVIIGFTRFGFYDDKVAFASLPDLVNRTSEPSLKNSLLREWYSIPAEGDAGPEILQAKLDWAGRNRALANQFDQESTAE